MSEINLPQHEADALLAMEKHRVSEREYTFSLPGQKENIELLSIDKREKFLLDLYRGRIRLRKVTMQNRARKSVTLARLDLNGRTHTNPDGQVLPTPHLHLYREGFGDKWAEAVLSEQFSDLDDIWITVQDFMRYCNITNPPTIERDLFT